MIVCLAVFNSILHNRMRIDLCFSLTNVRVSCSFVYHVRSFGFYSDHVICDLVNTCLNQLVPIKIRNHNHDINLDLSR